jgi:DNA-binding winged helix-turn-helix (wHTH) protein
MVPAGAAGPRRSHAADGRLAGEHWLFGHHSLEVGSQQLVTGDRRIQLDERGFAVLTCLLRHAGGVVPRATLVSEAWPGIPHVTDSAVSKTMRRLRIALGSEAARGLVTVYGVGYRLASPAVLVPAGASLPADRAPGVPGTQDARTLPTAKPPDDPDPDRAGAPPARPDRVRHHRVLVVTVLLLSALLVAWLLLGTVAH